MSFTQRILGRGRRALVVAGIGAATFALAACGGGGTDPLADSSGSPSAAAGGGKVVVGSADFTESQILGELYAQAMKAKGVDEIVGTSINDPFVMGAWNKDAGSEAITMLADGNGEFAEAIGLSMDASKFGMGKRSQRYSMIVNDGVVEQINVEAPGEYRASSAEHMLEQL